MATPFRKGREGDGTATYSDVQKIHQQLNYTNTAISTIATQLNQVATRLDTPNPTPSSSKTTETYANTIFPNPFSKSKVSLEKIRNTLLSRFQTL